uniref:Ubiquitin-like protease family profile domain-containing protein n=1 Tax=Oryza rufipogon TaxID=4529 RepID=A0A0E0QM90_ORYRU
MADQDGNARDEGPPQVPQQAHVSFALKMSSMTIACSIPKFVSLVQNFDSCQKEAIERIGFGGLLQMPDITLQRITCGHIADRFDVTTECVEIEGIQIPITTFDVQCIMGLPAGELLITPRPVSNDEDYKYYSVYKDPKKKNISLAILQEELLKAKVADEHFLRRFVLFAIGYILCPTTKPFVSSNYLALVKDINQIKHINWAALTRDFLIRSLKKLKGGRTNLEGNLPLLQVQDSKYKLTYGDRTPPLMSYWNEMKVNSWLKYDSKHGISGLNSANMDIVLGQLLQLQQSIQFLDNKMTNKLISIDGICNQNRKDIQEIEKRLRSAFHATSAKHPKVEIIHEQFNITNQEEVRTAQADDTKNTQTESVKTTRSDKEKGSSNQHTKHMMTSCTTRRNSQLLHRPQNAITINYISNCKDNILLSAINGVKLYSQFLRALVVPQEAPPTSKWLNGSLIKDEQADTPRGNGMALLESKAHCQQWKSDGAKKGTFSKTYRQRRATVASKYLNHDMIFLPLNRNKDHWYVVVLNAGKQKIQILDSIRMDRNTYKANKDLNDTIKGIDKFIAYATEDKSVTTR